MGWILEGKTIVSGFAKGEVLYTMQPIDFAADVDPKNGQIYKTNDKLFKKSISNKILVSPHIKKSLRADFILLELIEVGLGPAAIITIRAELILAMEQIVLQILAQKNIPVISLPDVAFLHMGYIKKAEVDGRNGCVIEDDSLFLGEHDNN
jgi:uncharacterized protein